MAQRDDVIALDGFRLSVGLSTIVGVTVTANQNAMIFKRFSGGTLEVGGASLTWGQGYIVGTNEIINVNSTGTFYLAATGATVTVMFLRGFD